MELTFVLVLAVYVIVPSFVLYWVIRFAVRHALRDHHDWLALEKSD